MGYIIRKTETSDLPELTNIYSSVSNVLTKAVAIWAFMDGLTFVT